MPMTFDVIYLGNAGSLDPTEGNQTAENAGSIVNQTFGSSANPLWNQVQTLTPGSNGDGNGAYEQDNNVLNEEFFIDGGPAQVFDAAVLYNATLTYFDGTTETITAVVFQDTAGNLYLAPESTQNADQDALEAKAIRSLTLDSVNNATAAGLGSDRDAAVFDTSPPCFTPGTLILTPAGERPVEALTVGDRVTTADRGPQPIRWIGRREIDVTHPAYRRGDKDKPILIGRGALAGAPRRDLIVSPQHRMVLAGPDVDAAFGTGQVLGLAKALTVLPGVRQMRGKRRFVYYALLFDRHEVIFAEGAPTESFRPGPVALQGFSPAQRAEILAVYPGLADGPAALGPPARPILKRRDAEWLLRRRRPASLPDSPAALQIAR